MSTENKIEPLKLEVSQGTWHYKAEHFRCPATDEYEGSYRVMIGDKTTVCLLDENGGEHDGELIADAGNAYQRTGLTPSEMVQTIADLRARVEAQRPGKVDPMGEDVWPALRADIEKAAVEWATYPDSHIMDSDLHGQFIRVMAYVIESTNILHRSPRFSAPAQPLSAQQVFDVVEEFIKQEAERVGTDQPTGLEYPVGHRHWNNMIADLRERLNKLIG